MPFKDRNIQSHITNQADWRQRYFTFKKIITVPSGESEAFILCSFLNSCTTQIHFGVPDLDDDDTAELIIKDDDGGDTSVIYASGEKGDDSHHVINVERVLVGDIWYVVECSGVQAADRRFMVKVYGYHG